MKRPALLNNNIIANARRRLVKRDAAAAVVRLDEDKIINKIIQKNAWRSQKPSRDKFFFSFSFSTVHFDPMVKSRVRNDVTREMPVPRMNARDSGQTAAPSTCIN